MSVAVKLAKSSLILFSIFVFAVIGLAGYMYVNMNNLAKGFVEQTASEALGVRVTIGAMDIKLEELKVLAQDIRIANPAGYAKADAAHLGEITIAAQSFDKKHLKFNLIEVKDAAFNLEIRPQGTNLGDLAKAAQAKPAMDKNAKSQSPNISIQKVTLTGTQITPSSTLIQRDLSPIALEPMTINDIGTDQQNGIPAKDAIVIVTSALITEIHKSANSAGVMEGLPLEVMNDIGVSTLDVFNKNLQKAYDNKVKAVGENIEKLKGMFSE